MVKTDLSRGTRPEGCAWADWLPRRAFGRGMCQLHGPAKGQRVTKLNCDADCRPDNLHALSTADGRLTVSPLTGENSIAGISSPRAFQSPGSAMANVATASGQKSKATTMHGQWLVIGCSSVLQLETAVRIATSCSSPRTTSPLQGRSSGAERAEPRRI